MNASSLNVEASMINTNNIGVQGGYRSMDVGYLYKRDTGTFKLKGAYFGVVARY